MFRFFGSAFGRGPDFRGFDAIRRIAAGPRTSGPQPKASPEKHDIVQIRPPLSPPWPGAPAPATPVRTHGDTPPKSGSARRRPPRSRAAVCATVPCAWRRLSALRTQVARRSCVTEGKKQKGASPADRTSGRSSTIPIIDIHRELPPGHTRELPSTDGARQALRRLDVRAAQHSAQYLLQVPRAVARAWMRREHKA